MKIIASFFAKIGKGKTIMEFYSKDFLLEHGRSLLDFYVPNLEHPLGGFHHNYKDDGAVFSPDFRHLVSSCRLVYNYCKGWELYGEPRFLELARKGWEFVEKVHFDPQRCAYHWTLEGNEPKDQTNHCYGLAFVLLMHATALKAGIGEARECLYRAFSMLNDHFWQQDVGLYADEATPDWATISDYRGQNANMHTCEACLAAYDATQDEVFLDRAYTLAQTIVLKLTQETDGLIWEHYHRDLSIDWDYNKDDPRNLYRPWGFQPGHQTEWAKLLMILHHFRPEDWMVERAELLFTTAWEVAWDSQYGGLLYGFAPDRTICDSDKYFWVQAESFAAAAHLFKVTGKAMYLDYYQKLWEYAWNNMIDHQFGAWYRLLTRENQKYSDEKSTAGGKCDYHTFGACYHVLKFALAD